MPQDLLLLVLAYKRQLTFGIVSSSGVPFPVKSFFTAPRLYLRDMQTPGSANWRRAIWELNICSDGEKVLEASLSHQDPAHRLPAFTDILGLWCRWLPIDGLSTNVIDNPFPFPLTTMGERHESRNVWRSELKRRATTLSEPCKHVLGFYDSWEKQNPRFFARCYRLWNTEPIFRQAFDATTQFFCCTEGLDFDLLYTDLIPCHIEVNAHSLQQAEENISNGHDKTRDSASLPNNRDPIFTERAYIYAENVPKFVEKMERRGPSFAKFSYEDVWWMMMMRLHAWTMGVQWQDRKGVKIPSEHYENPARVYIL